MTHPASLIQSLVSNRITIFLMENSKGFREYNSSDVFFDAYKNFYNHILQEYSYLYKKLLKKALESPYQYHKNMGDIEFFNYHGYYRKFQLYCFDFLNE